jgi:hypothetical protein
VHLVSFQGTTDAAQKGAGQCLKEVLLRCETSRGPRFLFMAAEKKMWPSIGEYFVGHVIIIIIIISPSKDE